MVKGFGILFFVAILSLSTQTKAQQVDSVLIDSSEIVVNKRKVRAYDPDRAALLSAVLPGMGQIYNRKYWKLPLVYGGAAILYATYKFNSDNYNKFQSEYTRILQKSTTTSSSTTIGTSNPLLQNSLRLKDAYRRQRDLTIIMGSFFYALVITDAYIDAHLKGFDLSEDLSLRVKPTVNYYAGKTYGGVTLNLAFKK